MPVPDLGEVRTEPGLGEAHSFSPPAGFDGTGEECLSLMRGRLKDAWHPHGQPMLVRARHAARNTVCCDGPYAREAQRVVEGLRSTLAMAAA